MTYYYTKDQARRLFDNWGFQQTALPARGRAVFCAFPIGQPSFTVTRSEKKSDSGKPLYQFQQYQPGGNP